MTSTSTNDLVITVARDLVTQLAPQELPLFRSASQQFRQHPERLLAGPQANDDPVGFGVGEAAALLTPAALAAMSSVISYLIEEISKVVIDKSATLLLDRVRQLLQKPEAAPQHHAQQLPLLTPAQLAQVREIARKQALVSRLSPARANALADAIVGKLAISMGA